MKPTPFSNVKLSQLSFYPKPQAFTFASEMSATKGKKKPRSSGLNSLYSQLAKRVVSESLSLKPGESVTVEAWNNGLDFAKDVVREAKSVGAIPLLILEDDEAYLWGIEHAPKEALGKMGAHEYGMLSSTDAYVFIPGPLIGVYTPSVTREESAAATAYNSSWYEAAEKTGLRGVRLTFGYVGQDLAKLLGKKKDDIVLRQLKSSLVDFQKLRMSGQPIMDRLKDGADVKIGTGSDSLSFRLKGDLGIEDGIADQNDVATKNNISYLIPGMIWKEVDPESANGKVTIFSSITRAGLISGAVLEFENGKLVSYKGKDKQNQQKLDALLQSMPAEARTLSMMTIGLNPVLPYGYAQDRFVSGAIALSGFGFTGVLNKAALSVNGEPIVEKGKLLNLSASSTESLTASA